MVFCSINGCKSKIGREKMSFYGIPAVLTRQCEVTMELSERRRKVWFERIYKPGFDEKDAPRYVRVCANHFVSGKPSALFDVANADWAPCINLGNTLCGLTKKGQLKRNKTPRKMRKSSEEEVETMCEIDNEKLKERDQKNTSENCESMEERRRPAIAESLPGTGSQTDITCEGFARLEALYKKVLEENISLRREVATLKSLVGGCSLIDDSSANSDNEASSAGLHKVEVILKTEPESCMDLPSSLMGEDERTHRANPNMGQNEDEDSPLDFSTSSPSQETRTRRAEDFPPAASPTLQSRGTRRQRLSRPHAVHRPEHLGAGAIWDRDHNQDDHEDGVDRETGSSESDGSTPRPRHHQRRPHQQKRTKRYPCAECGQKFISKQAQEIHQRIHTGERPYECPVCQRGFSVMSTLKAHMRTHTGERPFACQMCPRRFSEHGTLKCHMRTHTGEKPYECHECHKKFSENSTLRRHLLVHTGERPFECDQCDSKFIQKYNLNNHVRRVHLASAIGL